jgi:hypothetical protein
MHTIPGEKSRIRLLATVLRDVLAREQFAGADELKHAARARCRRLGLPCRQDHLDAALSLVGSSRALVTAAPAPVVPALRHVEPAAPITTRHEAALTLAAYGIDVRGGTFRLVRPSDVDTSSPDAPAGFRLVAVT